MGKDEIRTTFCLINSFYFVFRANIVCRRVLIQFDFAFTPPENAPQIEKQFRQALILITFVHNLKMNKTFRKKKYTPTTGASPLNIFNK